MNTLAEFINEFRPKIKNHLTEYLNSKLSENKEIPFYKDAVTRLLNFVGEGKLMRALLVLLISDAFGGGIENAMGVACAIELAHSALLIHDDIIDEDNVRRGKKTIHAQYEELAIQKQINNPKLYGQSMAICTADIAFFLAFELLSADIEPEIAVKLISDFSREISIVAAAEMEDSHYGACDEEPTIEEILNIYKFKSARYTFSLPFRLGALIGKADVDTISVLEEFGENLGIVFQIKDDEMGLFGTEENIGKPIGSDIKQNKKTIFRALLYQKADAGQKEILGKSFGNGNINQAGINKINEMILMLGVKDDTDGMVNKYSEQANKILSTLNVHQKCKNMLKELVDYNLSRSK